MRLPRPPRLHPVLAYAFALLTPLVALQLQLLFVGYVQQFPPFMLFFLAVFLASWLGGLGPGFLAIGASALLSNYYLLVPRFELALSCGSLLQLLLFVLASSIINLLSSSLRKALQDQERLLREAREAIRVRDDFLSVAGHELKTPLTALQLQVELLRRGVAKLGAQEAVRLEKVADHTRRLERLTLQLLDVSRLTSGRLHLEREEVDLGALAEEVVSRFSELASRSGSDLHLRKEGPCVFRWDRARLDQVLTNLVSNAVKYGAGMPIEVSVGVENGAALLQVKDQGIGIDELHQRRIFERFERAVSERHYGGLGLGLWITRQIVEAGGGTISVSSAPGQGSTFTVRLPLETEEPRRGGAGRLLAATLVTVALEDL